MKDLTVGKISPLIIKFAMPILLGSLFNQLYNIVDSIVAGNYIGEGALTVVGASFPIIFAFFALVIGIAQGVSIVISQYFGAKQMDKTKEAIFTMYVIVFVMSIVITILAISTSKLLFQLIELPKPLIADASLYLDIIMGGAIISFGLGATNSILRALGDSKTPLYFYIFASLLNIVLDLVFVVAFNLGIANLAIATVLAQFVTLIIALVYLSKTHTLLKGNLSDFTFNMGIFKKSLKIGLPTGFQQFFVAVGMMAIYKIVNQYETNIIDAFSAAGRIDTFAVMPSMSFAVALSVFVGQNIGANKHDRVKKGLLSTIYITSAISLISSALIIIFGHSIMRMFSPIPEVIEVGYEYLVIVSAFYVVFSIMFSFTGVFRGAGDTIIPMFITLLALWLVRVPISQYLSTKIGYTGIWWGIPLAWGVGCILSIIYYFTNSWKKKRVVN